MLSDKAKLALLDIRDNILIAQQFTQGISFEEFANSGPHFYAVTRADHVRGIAAPPRKLSRQNVTLPWKKIMGIRNVDRHSYDNVKETFVWSTVHQHLARCLRSSSLKSRRSTDES